MPLLQVMIVLIVAGVLLWLAKAYIPMDPAVSRVLTIVVVCVLVLWVLSLFGALDYFSAIKVGRR